MTKRVKKALLKSIEHWHENLDMLILNHLSGEPLSREVYTTADNCALCAIFNTCNLCEGCPVYNFSGWSLCEGTPYEDVVKWICWLMFYPRSVSGAYKRGYEVISKELEFLYSLLLAR